MCVELRVLRHRVSESAKTSPIQNTPTFKAKKSNNTFKTVNNIFMFVPFGKQIVQIIAKISIPIIRDNQKFYV